MIIILFRMSNLNYGSFKFDFSSLYFQYLSTSLNIPDNAKIFIETSIQTRPKVILNVKPLADEDPKAKKPKGKDAPSEVPTGLVEDNDGKPEKPLNKFQRLSFMPEKEIVIKSNKYSPSITDNEGGELKNCQILFQNNGFLSSLIQLDSETINRLCQSSIIFTVYLELPQTTAPSAAPSKKKDAAPVPTGPTNISLFKFGLSLGSFISGRCEPISVQNITLEKLFKFSYKNSHTNSLFFSIDKHESLDYSNIEISFTLAPDIPLSEFVSYSVTLWISSGKLENLTENLLLQFPQEDLSGGTDKKAKQTLTPEESREKYINTLNNYLEAQLSLVRYHLILQSDKNDDEEEKNNENKINLDIKLNLRNGLLNLNKNKIQDLSLTEPLLSSSSIIFSLDFNQMSSYYFISKDDLYSLLINYHHFSMPFELKFLLKKEILNAEQGDEVIYEGRINLCPLLNNNSNLTLQLPLEYIKNSDLEENNKNFGQINFEISNNLFNSIVYSALFPQEMNQSSLDAFSTHSSSFPNNNSAGHFPLEKSESHRSIHSSTTVSMSGNSIQNLRDQIYSALLIITKKFIENKTNNTNFGDHISQSSEKLNSIGSPEEEPIICFNDFLQYLTSSNVLKELIDTFRPRVLSLIAEKYAKPVRRPSTQSFLMLNDDHLTNNNDFDHVHEVDLSLIYSDLYTYLIQQAHAVLAYVTESIRFNITKEEVFKGNYPLSLIKNKEDNDDNSNLKVKLLEDLNLLLIQSYDSLADLKYELTNSYHKERISILENKELRNNIELIISVYLDYGKFLLYWRKNNIEFSENPSANNDDLLKNNEILEDSRICFEYIYSLINNNANNNNKDKNFKNKNLKQKNLLIIILYCNILMELGLFSHAELILYQVLMSEMDIKNNNYLLLNNLDEFLLWNDKKNQSKISSIVYYTLSIYFTLINKHLYAYKAMNLAKSTISSNSSSNVSYNFLTSFINHASWCCSFGLFRCSESIYSLITNAFQRLEIENNFYEKVEEIPILFLKKYKKLEIEILFSSTTNYDLLLNKIDSLRFYDENTNKKSDKNQVNSSSNFILNDGDESYYTFSKLLQIKLLRKVEKITGSSHYDTIINNYILAFSKSPSQFSLHSYLHFLSLLSSSTSSTSASITVASTAMKHYPKSSTLKLQLSLIYLTKSQLENDEESKENSFQKYSFLVEQNLRSANLLDPKNPDIWAGWTLYLLSQCINENIIRNNNENSINTVGSGKLILKQAEDSLFQCFRLGLESIDTLLKLAHSFLLVGMPSTSEYIINNCIKINSMKNSSYNNSYFYKLLGDSQLHQGNYMSAVENYQRYLYDENILDNDKKISVAIECISLLKLLGREEEILNVYNILNYLNKNKLEQEQVQHDSNYIDPSIFTASGNIDPNVFNSYDNDEYEGHEEN